MNFKLFLSAIILFGLMAGCDDDKTIVNIEAPTNVPSRVAAVGGDSQVGAVWTRSSNPLAARVTTDSGEPVENVQVSFAVEEGDALLDIESAITDANGVALAYFRFGKTIGESSFRASVPGLDGSPVVFRAMAVAQDASMINNVSGHLQTGVVGEVLADPIVVKTTDGYGNPVSGVMVYFDALAENAFAVPDSMESDAEGFASAIWTLGSRVGAQELHVTGRGVSGYRLDYDATATTGAPARLEPYIGDNQVGIEGELLDKLYVKVADLFSNGVAGALVEFRLIQGDGRLHDLSATTNSNGLAYTSLYLGTAGPHEVMVTSDSLPPLTLRAVAYERPSLTQLTPTFTSIRVEWAMNAGEGFASYSLYRYTDPYNTHIRELMANIADETVTSFEDFDVELGTRYYYLLHLNLATGESLVSNIKSEVAGFYYDLSGYVYDMEYDPIRKRLYASIPTRDRITVVSAETLRRIEVFSVHPSPFGISLSQDGSILYCALYGSGSIGAVDLASGAMETISVQDEVGDHRTQDVLEATPGTVLVTASPFTEGFAYVAKVDIDFTNGHTVSRIADGRMIKADPKLAKSSDGLTVYVGQSFSPNFLYKLDMTDPAGPIVLQNDIPVSGVTRVAVSPDDTRIFLGSGQVLETSTFDQIALIGSGYPSFSSDGSICYMGIETSITGYNSSTYQLVSVTPAPYPMGPFVSLEDLGYFVVFSGGRIFAVPMPVP